MKWKGVKEIQVAYRNGTKVAEVIEAMVQRRAESERFGAFLTTVGREQLLRQAAESQQRLDGAGSGARALEGVPVAVKDVFLTQGVRTTCGSAMLQHYEPPYSAAVVERLQQAGAILVGKTSLDEFSMGSESTHVPAEFPHGRAIHPRSPPDGPALVAGGSSGGSAVAVATGAAAAAFGTDTGGSVRLPASYCGLVGLRPTYGRISRWGVVAYANSLDTPALFTHSVEDCASVLQAVAGFDERDGTSSERAVPDYGRAVELADSPAEEAGGVLRVGVPLEYDLEELHPDARTAWYRAMALLRKATGAELRPVSLPHTKVAVPVYYVLASAEAASNMARYDGVRFGERRAEAEPATLRDMYCSARSRGLGREVQRRILVGNFVTSSAHFDDFFVHAQKVRRKIASEMHERLRQDVDVLLTPMAVGPTYPVGTLRNPVDHYATDVFAVPAALAGLPAISIPFPETQLSQSLPIGLQLIGPAFMEHKLLYAARLLEKSLLLD